MDLQPRIYQTTHVVFIMLDGLVQFMCVYMCSGVHVLVFVVNYWLSELVICTCILSYSYSVDYLCHVQN